MTSYLGLPLDEAKDELEKCGKKVSTVLITCRKGALGNEKRVIRSRQLSDGSVELVYSFFQTSPDKEGNTDK
ncbi:MAG: hypothetical protein IJO48_05170 [Clostridia bacterium]|nr:hypothetical protein [Clostridia bacterium]